MNWFEEWWETQEGKWSLICCPTIAKLAYHNALEKVLNNLNFGGKVAYSDADILMAIKKDIKEELNNKN